MIMLVTDGECIAEVPREGIEVIKKQELNTLINIRMQCHKVYYQSGLCFIFV